MTKILTVIALFLTCIFSTLSAYAGVDSPYIVDYVTVGNTSIVALVKDKNLKKYKNETKKQLKRIKSECLTHGNEKTDIYKSCVYDHTFRSYISESEYKQYVKMSAKYTHKISNK